jgi:hypothetical protein
VTTQRPSLAQRQRESHLTREDSILSSSPSTSQFRPRHTVGSGSARPSSRSGFTGSTTTSASSSAARMQPRTTLGTRSRVQNGSTMRKMAGLLQNLRELQATVHSATRVPAASDGQASAIPRPSSRLSSSVGPSASAGTPRRSIDGRRDEIGTPSAIPLPTNGLSRSTSQRPSSRLSMQHSGMTGTTLSRVPSSVRSQTPNLEHYTSLDFLDKDPADSQTQYRRRSHLALSTASSSVNIQSSAHMPSLPSVRSSLDRGGDRDLHRSQSSQTSSSYSGVRPRGSTFSSNMAPLSSNSTYRRDDPTAATAAALNARRALHNRAKQPPPPPPSAALRMTEGVLSRQRSTSIGPSHAAK